MKLVCAWCGKNIERPGYTPDFETTTSHGICRACSEGFSSQERGSSLQHHLDTIPVPVLLIGSQAEVLDMNGKASAILARESGETEPQLQDKVFDCVHSRTPEGCGRKIHSSGCTIRRCAMETFQTGGSHIFVPATLTVRDPDDVSKIVLSITTMKRDGLVLLRVESA